MEKSTDITSVVNLLWTGEEVIEVTGPPSDKPEMKLDCPGGVTPGGPMPTISVSTLCPL